MISVTMTDRMDGFTLFETLVAMMIFATALVVILQLFSGGLRANHISEQYTLAVLHAREKMDELLLDEKISTEVMTGEWEDGFSWRAEYVRLEEVDDGDETPAPFRLDLIVSWTEGDKQRNVDVSTIRIGKADTDGSQEP